jgi:hypothetical protein
MELLFRCALIAPRQGGGGQAGFVWQRLHVLFELELELIQTRMIQKPLLWVEVGKNACVLVGICELRIAPLSACSIRPAMPLTFGLSLWVPGPRPMDCRSSTDPERDVEQFDERAVLN